jgi:hypothetical protein
VTLSRLAETVRADGGGLLAATVRDGGGEAPHGAAVAAGTRSAGHEAEYALLLEAVYEGYLLHYGEPRAFSGMDPDLRLLAGDTLYALGLARLAERGDVEAVAELADLISLCAWAEAEDRRSLVPELWEATVSALSPGGGPGARAALGDRLR